MNSIEIDNNLKGSLKKNLGINDQQIDVWLEHAIIRNYNKGDFIIERGQVEKYLSIVIEGLTRHYIINTKGDDVSYDFSFKYEYSFDYASFITQKPAKFFISALSDVKLLSIPRKDIQNLYEKYPATNIFGRISAENYYIWREERELALQTLTPDERYKWLIEKHSHYVANVPLKYLSSFLNLTPETLSRIRSRFPKQK
jgi:CRP-like cAMP-binding protein